MDDQGTGSVVASSAPAKPGPELGGNLPPVVVVVVTHDPGPWFDETLRSFKEQTYSALSVLVIDAAGDESPTPRIAAELPNAYVRRIDRNDGYGAAANEVLGVVEGAAFYLLCHDDVALEPDTIRTLVEEAFRSNAGIAGAKLVDWNDARRLRQVGASVDKTGVLAPFAEPGELDQEQHDAVRDVFIIPGGCTLIRADLFAELGGFDTGIDFLGDDVDLCWRAHLAGARVLIVPSATVRHLEALGDRRPDDRRRLQARHRLRTVLSCYSPLSLLRVVPQAMALAVIEVLYALVAGQPGQARDVAGAWPWNMRRAGSILRKRRAIRTFRTVRDIEIRHLQVRGSARFSAFIRGQIGKGDDRVSAVSRSGRQFAGTLKARSSRATLILGVVVVAVVLLGTRNLLVRPIPAIGELATLPSSPNTLLLEWANGWRSAGLGFEGPAPTGLGLLGGLGWVFLGATGLLRKVLILGMLPIGFFGAWRMARPIGSLRAGIAAFVVYAAIPVPYNALASGSWGGLILYATAPWILLQLARASRLAPYGRDDLPEDSPEAEATPQSRPFARQVISLGLLLALIGSFVPFVVALALIVSLGMALGSLVSGQRQGAGRMVLVALAASALAAVLHLPWSVDLLRPGAQWTAFAGIGASRGGVLSVANLLGFETGPFGAPPLGWVFLVAGALPIVIGRGWRYQWAVRAWFVALAGWLVLWAGQERWLPVALPPAEVLLAPVAAALALTVAMGMAAFEVDLPGYRFGWRQAVSTMAAIAVVVGVLPLLGGVVDGRWRVAGGDLNRPLATVLAQNGSPAARVLWVGDPVLIPIDGYRLDDRLSYGTSDGIPAIADRWSGSPRGATALLGDSLRLAAQRRTSRVGALLAPMGVRYIVIPRANVPTAYDGITRPAPRSFVDALDEQLDLREVDSDPSLIIYRNTAFTGMVTSPPQGTKIGDSYTDALGGGTPGTGLAASKPVLTRTGPTTWEGTASLPGDVVLSESFSPHWRLKVAGTEVGRSKAFGWATRFNVTDPGRARLTFATPLVYRLLCVLQVALWIGALFLLRQTSPRRRRRLFHLIPVEDPHDVLEVPPMRTEEELVELLSQEPHPATDTSTRRSPDQLKPVHGIFEEAADSTPHRPEEPWEPS